MVVGALWRTEVSSRGGEGPALAVLREDVGVNQAGTQDSPRRPYFSQLVRGAGCEGRGHPYSPVHFQG